MRGLTVRGASRIIRLDSDTGSIINTDVIQHLINEGNLFVALLQPTPPIPKNGVYYFRITTADIPEWTHLRYRMGSSKDGRLQFFEGPTEHVVPVYGDIVPVVNMNRNIDNTYDTEVASNADFATDGKILADIAAPEGEPVGPADYWVLRQNTTYTIKFTAFEKNTVLFGGIKWYEQPRIK
jgi:hypothetical protein